MKKYHSIRQDLNPAVSGLKTGETSIAFDPKMLNTANKANYDYLAGGKGTGKIPEFELFLDGLKIKKRAKLLDFMYYDDAVPRGKFLVSPRAQEVLQRFDLPEHRFYEVNLKDVNDVEVKGYKLFYYTFYDDLADIHVNWEKTIFSARLKPYIPITMQDFIFNSLEDWRNWWEKNNKQTIGGINCKQLVLKKTFPFPDLLAFTTFNTGLLVSGDLANAIVNENLTGLDFGNPHIPIEFES